VNKFLRYVVMLIAALTILSAWVLRAQRLPFPDTPGPKFDDQVAHVIPDALTETKPDLVLMGDSVVELNIDSQALQEDLGLKIFPLHFNGSSFTLWYLAIKNAIIPSPDRPQTLVIVFRDTTMTLPSYRAQGNYEQSIESLATSRDTLVVQRAFVDTMNPLEKLSESYLPLYYGRAYLRQTADNYMRYVPARTLLDCRKRCVDTAIDSIVTGQNWDPATLNNYIASMEDVLYTRRALDFPARVQESFLPDVIQLCRENHIRLIFVHARSLRLYRNAYEPALLDRYLGDLAAYLAANGVPYLDIADDPRILPGDFADSIHIFPQAKGRYTDAIAVALRTVLP
jgi:hypothetical protein